MIVSASTICSLLVLSVGLSLSRPAAGSESDLAGASNELALRVLSLNIFGHATMPAAASRYAALANENLVDVLGVQEGVHDWKISGLPTDYSRSLALESALGQCWERRYQVFINTCQGVSFISHERFDMTDGPNAVRTGERALLEKDGREFVFINVHWDHESKPARMANAAETAAASRLDPPSPTIVLGDFNAACESEATNLMKSQADLQLIHGAGIDCVFARGASGHGQSIDAAPSDHPGVLADIRVQ